MIVATRQFGPAIRVRTHARLNYVAYALHTSAITLSVAWDNWLLLGLCNIPAAMGSLAIAEKAARSKRARQEAAEVALEERMAAAEEAEREYRERHAKAIKARNTAKKYRAFYEAAFEAKEYAHHNAPSTHKWIASRYA